MKDFIRKSWHWPVLFMLLDATALFSVWILRPGAFKYLSLFLFLFSAIFLAAGIYLESRRSKRDAAAVLRFLEMPDERTKADLLAHLNEDEIILALCSQYLSMQWQVNEKTAELAEYRDYIEAWVHEAKTPLSLSTMVLDNHSDEMPPYLHTRLQYVQHQLNEDVERILYYARLQTDHPDIRFTRFRLDECVLEILSEYKPFLEEKRIDLALDLEPADVDSDRKIVSFMLSQLLSNASKYADGSDGKMAVTLTRTGDKVSLCLSNNGVGVPPEDRPFLFDKGFTGSYPNRQKATGMGLYLVRKYGQKLCIDLRLSEHIPYESGFGIEMVFTR